MQNTRTLIRDTPLFGGLEAHAHLHCLERLHQTPKIVATRSVDMAVEAPLGEGGKDLANPPQRMEYPPRQHQAHDDRKEPGQQHGGDHLRPHGPILCQCSRILGVGLLDLVLLELAGGGEGVGHGRIDHRQQGAIRIVELRAGK